MGRGLAPPVLTLDSGRLMVLCWLPRLSQKIHFTLKVEEDFYGLQGMSDSENKRGVLNPMCRHLNPSHLI